MLVCKLCDILTASLGGDNVVSLLGRSGGDYTVPPTQKCESVQVGFFLGLNMELITEAVLAGFAGYTLGSIIEFFRALDRKCDKILKGV